MYTGQAQNITIMYSWCFGTACETRGYNTAVTARDDPRYIAGGCVHNRLCEDLSASYPVEHQPAERHVQHNNTCYPVRILSISRLLLFVAID